MRRLHEKATKVEEAGRQKDDVAGGRRVPPLGTRDEGSLANACETFLAGGIFEVFRGSGMLVPPWAWASLVAHARPERLRDLAAGAALPGAGEGERKWRQAVVSLAALVVELAGDDAGAVSELQREALFPLEHELGGTYAQLLWLAGGDGGTVRALRDGQFVPAGREPLRGGGVSVTPEAFLRVAAAALREAAWRREVRGAELDGRARS